MGERPHVGVQENVLSFVQVSAGIGPPRSRQAQYEQLHLGQGVAQVHRHGAEVDLGVVAQWVGLGDRHLGQRHLLAGLDHDDVAAHGPFAELGPVLFDQALPDPPGRVALLAGLGLVLLEPLIDQRLPGVDLG
jgi:hypothetical protein